jgi:hypothetical protein
MLRFFILFDQGQFSPAMRTMRRCLELAEAGGFVYPQVGGRALLAMLLGQLGKPGEAEALLESAMRFAEQLLPLERASVLLPWAWLALHHGDLARAQSLLAVAQEVINPDDYLSPNPMLLAKLESDLALRQGQPELALQAARRFGQDQLAGFMATFQPDLLLSEGRALLALGRAAEALTVLERAYARAAAQPSPRACWTIAGTLAESAYTHGDLPTAQRWRAAARRHLGYLIEHIEEDDLRANFLARPDVRATLEAA